MRGDIYRLSASKAATDQDPRYAIVIQSDHLPLSTVVIAPTSTRCTPTSFRPQIDVAGVPTTVMLDQITAVDVQVRLGARVGRLSVDEIRLLDQALVDVLDLS